MSQFLPVFNVSIIISIVRPEPNGNKGTCVVLIWAWLRVLRLLLSSHRQLKLHYHNLAGELQIPISSTSPREELEISCVAVANLPPSPPPSFPPFPALQHHCHTASSSFINSFRTGAADPLRNNALGNFFFTSPRSTEEKILSSILLI